MSKKRGGEPNAVEPVINQAEIGLVIPNPEYLRDIINRIHKEKIEASLQEDMSTLMDFLKKVKKMTKQGHKVPMETIEEAHLAMEEMNKNLGGAPDELIVEINNYFESVEELIAKLAEE